MTFTFFLSYYFYLLLWIGWRIWCNYTTFAVSYILFETRISFQYTYSELCLMEIYNYLIFFTLNIIQILSYTERLFVFNYLDHYLWQFAVQDLAPAIKIIIIMHSAWNMIQWYIVRFMFFKVVVHTYFISHRTSLGFRFAKKT